MKKTIKTNLLGIILVCLANLVFCILEFYNARLMNNVALDALQFPYKISGNVSRMMIIVTEMRVDFDHLVNNLSPDEIDRMESGLEEKHAAIKAEYPGPVEYPQNLIQSIDHAKKVQFYILRQARLNHQEEVHRLIDNLLLPSRRSG